MLVATFAHAAAQRLKHTAHPLRCLLHEADALLNMAEH
jgi:hypothetical protein